MRRFELDGNPRRFWELQLSGLRVEMRWGEIGTPGQTFSRGFNSEGEAQTFIERQVILQMERGWSEVTVAKPVATSAEVTVERFQRFEWKAKDGRKFVEVAQEGSKVTMRGGRIVDGRDVADRENLHVQSHGSVRAASVAFDERCADVRYQGGHAVEAEPTHALHANAELEAQCESSRDSEEPWAVYADWLIAHGDARGEIAQLQLAGKTVEAKRVLGQHLHDLCGTDAGKLVFEFRHGFAVGCTIVAESDTDELLEDITRAFLASPMARFVESLRFGLAGHGNENDWAPTLHAVANSPRAAHIRELRFDRYDYHDSEISWTPFGDFTGAWSKLPALELLHIKSGAGGTLGTLDLPNLRTFIRESGGLAATEIADILAAKWPRLEHLEIWFGSQNYGAEGDLESIRPILDRKGLPALRHLGIVNCEFIDAVIPELARSKILPQLHSLDLSKGVMARVATAELVKHARAFRHLASIDLDGNMLLADEVTQIRDVLDNVVPGVQREREYNDDDDEELDRYCAVAE